MIAKDIKRGHIVNYHGAPCMIETINVQSPSARGAATFYKYRAQEPDHQAEGRHHAPRRRLAGRGRFPEASRQVHVRRPGRGPSARRGNYEQYSLPRDDLSDELHYLTEQLEGVQALIYNDQCVGVQLPVAVELKVVRCDPGIKGASATARTKPATLETGLIVQVPEYLAEGELIKVDTRNGAYLSRA